MSTSFKKFEGKKRIKKKIKLRSRWYWVYVNLYVLLESESARFIFVTVGAFQTFCLSLAGWYHTRATCSELRHLKGWRGQSQGVGVLCSGNQMLHPWQKQSRARKLKDATRHLLHSCKAFKETQQASQGKAGSNHISWGSKRCPKSSNSPFTSGISSVSGEFPTIHTEATKDLETATSQSKSHCWQSQFLKDFASDLRKAIMGKSI